MGEEDCSAAIAFQPESIEGVLLVSLCLDSFLIFVPEMGDGFTTGKTADWYKHIISWGKGFKKLLLVGLFNKG